MSDRPGKPRTPAGETRFIFVTGGVVSALGKGIAAASIGRLLVSRGFRVQLQKFDPYINVDPGTMSPFQHGEVFVTEDGAETDLDLGHYERYTGENASRASNVTAGAVYNSVIKQGAPRRLPRRHRAGDPAHHRRDQAADPDRRRGPVGRLRDHRDRRHRRRHRVAAVPRGDPPALHRPRPAPLHVPAPDARPLRRPRRRAEDEADPALDQRAAPDRHPAARRHLPLRGRPRPRDPPQDRALRLGARGGRDLRPRRRQHLQGAARLPRRGHGRPDPRPLRDRGAGPRPDRLGGALPPRRRRRPARSGSRWSASTCSSRTPTSR